MTDQTLRQLQQHGTSSFPISVSFVYLSEYKGMQFPHHWHDEFEFLLIHSGQMRYTANNESVVLDPGDAIFFNSGALHTGAAVALKDCTYFAVTLHPDFFGMPGTALAENYITPFCDSPFFNFYKFAASREADRPVLRTLESVCALYDTQDVCRDIDIYTHVLLLWRALFLCCRDSLSFDFYSSESERLHKMLAYIKTNYNQPIMLD